MSFSFTIPSLLDTTSQHRVIILIHLIPYMVALSMTTLYVVRPQRPAHDRSDSRQTGEWGRMSVTHVSPLERHPESVAHLGPV